MRALVTGVAGFIGSHLARRLLADGHHVAGIDALTDYYDVELKRANLASLFGDRFEFIHADLNEVDLTSILSNTDVVFHLAGQPGVRKSWGRDFSTYVAENVLATQRLLEAARSNGAIQRFVYASSSSVYGNAESFPTNEEVVPRPQSPYGVTKLAAEHLCGLYADNFGVPTVSLRYFTVYGPRQRPDMAFARFVKAAINDSQIRIFGDGEQIRDFTFVEDVVQANILAASIDSRPGSVFNVAGGTSISVNAVLRLLEEISGLRLRVEYLSPVAGDVSRTGGDTRRIADDLGWQPYIGVEEGLRSQLAWARASD